MDLDKEELQATHEILYSPNGFGKACFDMEKLSKQYIHNFVSDGVLEKVAGIVNNTRWQDSSKISQIRELLEKYNRI